MPRSPTELRAGVPGSGDSRISLQTSRNQTCVDSKTLRPRCFASKKKNAVENGQQDPTRNPQSCMWLGSTGATQEEDGLSLVSLATDSQSHILLAIKPSWQCTRDRPTGGQSPGRSHDVQFSGFQHYIVLLARPETATAEHRNGSGQTKTWPRPLCKHRRPLQPAASRLAAPLQRRKTSRYKGAADSRRHGAKVHAGSWPWHQKVKRDNPSLAECRSTEPPPP